MTPRILLAYWGEHQSFIKDELSEYEVVVSYDPMTAVANAEDKGRRFDLMLLDAEKEDSFEAVEYARDCGCEAKVIFCSKDDEVRQRVRAAEANCDAFVLLPDELGDVCLIVKALLEDL